MKDYDKNKESSYLKYWDVYDIYRWVMSKMMPVNVFCALAIHLYFLESYNEDSDEGYFLEVEVQYPKGFRQLHNYLSNKKKLSNLWST